MVHLAQIDAHPRADPLEDAIATRLEDIDSEQYRRTSASVLRTWADYHRLEHDCTDVAQIDVDELREYARALRRTTRDGGEAASSGITTSSARQYWSIVSSFLSWAINEGLIDRNPATLNRAQEPLPTSETEQPDTQFWSEDDRDAICMAADRHIDQLLDTDHSTHDRIKAYRDRGIIYALAYTGCRSAELLSVSGDEQRNGITWEDIDLEAGQLTVFGKSREYETAVIFEPAIGPLERLQSVLDPEPDWPVFPSVHLPTLYGLLPDDESSSPTTIWADLRDHGVTPPSMSTEGARRVLRRRCEDSRYEFSEPLKPHGARRGLGTQMYRESAEAAQDVLRHQSIETTHEQYHEERVRELKTIGDELFTEDETDTETPNND